MTIVPFFRRHFLLTVLVFVALTGIATFLSHFLTRPQRIDILKAHADFMVGLVDDYQGDKEKFVAELNERSRRANLPYELKLVPPENPTPQKRAVARPVAAERKNLLTTYAPRNRGFFSGPVVSFIASLVAIVLGSILCMILLFRSIQDRAEMAQDVLGRMQGGDLKARFPVSRWDEGAQIVKLFNQMADEIERLVDRLKEKEKSRLHLLQELAHDLRTPVSSLKNLVESLRFNEDALDKATREDLKKLAYNETEYMTNLVDDLLFLALLFEPKYKDDHGGFCVQEVMRAQIKATSSAHPGIQANFTCDLPESSSHWRGSPHSLSRLFRNALENSFSFAKSKVDIHIGEYDRHLRITVYDDGPGFSDEALANFGKKRATRYLNDKHRDGRLSVGLGSVIIQAVVAAHGGHVQVQNVLDENGKKSGAQLTIEIPRSGFASAQNPAPL